METRESYKRRIKEFQEAIDSTSINDKWEHFKKCTMPSNAGEKQREVMKSSFFAGAISVYQLILDIEKIKDQEKRLKVYAELHAELTSFATSHIAAMLKESDEEVMQ